MERHRIIDKHFCAIIHYKSNPTEYSVLIKLESLFRKFYTIFSQENCSINGICLCNPFRVLLTKIYIVRSRCLSLEIAFFCSTSIYILLQVLFALVVLKVACLTVGHLMILQVAQVPSQPFARELGTTPV